jgi:GTP cyclohydrolase II
LVAIGRYRRKTDKLVERAATAPIPTMWGPFISYCYRSLLDGIEHIAMVKVSKSSEFDNYMLKWSYLNYGTPILNNLSMRIVN